MGWKWNFKMEELPNHGWLPSICLNDLQRSASFYVKLQYNPNSELHNSQKTKPVFI